MQQWKNEYYKLGNLLIMVERHEDGAASIRKFNRDTKQFEDGSAYWAKVSLGRDDDLEVIDEAEFKRQMTLKKIHPNWRESETAKRAVEEVSKWPQWKRDAADARFSIKSKKLECPCCGMVLQKYKEAGKLWCPECKLGEVGGIDPEAIKGLDE